MPSLCFQLCRVTSAADNSCRLVKALHNRFFRVRCSAQPWTPRAIPFLSRSMLSYDSAALGLVMYERLTCPCPYHPL